MHYFNLFEYPALQKSVKYAVYYFPYTMLVYLFYLMTSITYLCADVQKTSAKIIFFNIIIVVLPLFFSYYKYVSPSPPQFTQRDHLNLFHDKSACNLALYISTNTCF